MRNIPRWFGLRTLVIAVVALGCETSFEPGEGRPFMILLDAGGAQGANVGSALLTAPAVKVVDRQGNPVPGVQVTFEIESGGGTITGPMATTDANGRAAVGSWTIGSVGENQLTANADGVAPLFISAVGRCIAGSTIALNTSAVGELSIGDCTYANGELTDRYQFTVSSARAVRFTQASTTVNSYLELQGPGNVVGFYGTERTDDDASFKALLAAGTYDLNPSSFDPADVGAYSVTAEAAPENEPGCEIVFAVPGIETVQALAADDCASRAIRYDAIAIYLHEGRTYTFTMTSLTVDSYLELRDYDNDEVVAVNGDISSANRNARISVKPQFSGFFLLIASHEGAALGAYSLSIQ